MPTKSQTRSPRPDEDKRRGILDVAARLFATRPFHEVRLEDVAAAAQVGKGTVYLYFKSKDDLFASLSLDGYQRLVEQLQALDSKLPALRRLETVVRELVTFAKAHPHFYRVMQESPQSEATRELRKARDTVGRIAGKIIATGVRSGELSDPHPEVTGQFIPACVRSAIVFGPASLKAETIVEQVMHVVGRGIARKR